MLTIRRTQGFSSTPPGLAGTRKTRSVILKGTCQRAEREDYWCRTQSGNAAGSGRDVTKGDTKIAVTLAREVAEFGRS